ncbi:MAG: cytochrome B [Limnohabitans sp.]|nr:cytochrome B [Limnohabitans sp.]
MNNHTSSRPARIWDLPTRLFHVFLTVLFAALVVSGNLGGNALDWHARFGFAMFASILFRVVWGFVGGYWSRFLTFTPSPKNLWRYLFTSHPNSASHGAGYNPIGALSVYAFLFFLAAQIATGLIADDEIAFTGPLSHLVSNSLSLSATWYHKEVGKKILLLLVAVHIVAVLFHLYCKKNNLIRPMITGDKVLQMDTTVSNDGWRQRLLALIIAVACAGLVRMLISI